MCIYHYSKVSDFSCFVLMICVIDNKGYILDYSSQTLSLETSFTRTGDTYAAIHKNSVAILDKSGASGSGNVINYA